VPHRWLMVLVLELLPLSSLACGPAQRPGFVQADHPDLHYVGWFDRSTPAAPRCAWAGSQITADFSGTSVRAHLTDRPVDDLQR
jgi:hypothetical protein